MVAPFSTRPGEIESRAAAPTTCRNARRQTFFGTPACVSAFLSREHTYEGMPMKHRLITAAAAALLCATAGANGPIEDFSAEVHAVRQVREGRETFRYATFGDEAFW